MDINKQQLSLYAKPRNIAANSNDTEEPLNMSMWLQNHVGVDKQQEYTLYNQYLIDWYSAKKTNTSTDTRRYQVRINYLALLKQLQTFFTKPEKESWYNFINFQDDREILLAIPIFAKKLKEISLHLIEQRKKVKNTKLRYNTGGTGNNIIYEVRELLLQNFTVHNNTLSLPSNIQNNVNELSAIKDSLVIQVEECYDDHSYFDQNTSLPVSAYYDLNDNTTSKFFTTKKLNLSGDSFLFKNTIDRKNELNFDVEYGIELADEYISKYAGQNATTSSLPSISTSVDTYEINIREGNNFFLWPGKVYRSDVPPEKIYTTVALTALDIEKLGTAGTELINSDTVFVRSAQGIKGAWLRHINVHTTQDVMVSYIDKMQKTIFMMPFPGYGLSGNGIEWSGPLTQFSSEYFYLDDSIKKNIESLYWNTNTSLTTIDPLTINDTTLISAQAYASSYFINADKVRIFQNPPYYKESNYSGIIDETWLYKFNRTDIPLKKNSDTTVFWPYEIVDPEESIPQYFPADPTFITHPAKIEDIDFSLATASTTMSSADCIFKLKDHTHNIEEAVECAWLSGASIEYYPNIGGADQPNFSLYATAGVYTRFVWNGPNYTPVDEVFKYVPHEPDCAFNKDRALGIKDHAKCNCRSILFSPLGHPGDKLTDYQSVTDIIFEDVEASTTGNFQPVDMSTWSDRYGQFTDTSTQYCRFKTNSNIGWNSGRWISELPGPTLRLETGRVYTYYRASAAGHSLPPYVLRHNFNIFKSNRFIWIRAEKDANGTWKDTGTRSKMILRPRDIVLYRRRDTMNFTLSSDRVEIQTINENRNSAWSNYNYLTIPQPADALTNLSQTVYVTYPGKTLTPSISTTLTPTVPFDKIVEFTSWTLTCPDLSVITYTNVPYFSFTPTLPGIYYIQLNALSGTKDTFTVGTTGNIVHTPGVKVPCTFTNIPAITAIDYNVHVAAITAFNISTPGFVLNTNLYGWNYNNYAPTASLAVLGARPFWAKSYIEKEVENDYKGALNWSPPFRVFDEHNIVTQPKFSDIILQTGQYLEYDRQHPTPFYWTQPIVLNASIDEKKWCVINFNLSTVSSLSSTLDYLAANVNLLTYPTTAVSPITFTNFLENEPVEVYYNAINQYTWTVNVTADILNTTLTDSVSSVAFVASRPWAQLANRFNSTNPHIPTLQSVYTQNNKGGYFLPSGLGFSLYNSKDYTYTTGTSAVLLTSVFEDVSKHYAGRGVTKLDNVNPYTDLKENAVWLKDSYLTDILAGNVKREIAKKYQNFIPYQSGIETNKQKQPGLITTDTSLTPWGKRDDKTWIDNIDSVTAPLFTGETNTELWSEFQQLKNTKKRTYNWVTDIFGNQYALYKDIKDVNPYERKDILGELWVKKQTGVVMSAARALSAVFDTYKGLPLYTELTGNGIKKIDVFFDTLYIETTGAVLLEKIQYEYGTDNIFSFTDSSHSLSLYYPIQTSLNREFLSLNTLSSLPIAVVGETWFIPEQKIVVLSVCELSGNNTQPYLYELDIAKETFRRVFPI